MKAQGQGQPTCPCRPCGASPRRQQLAAYGDSAAAALAAAYGFGLARNHPWADGNKRTAFVAVELFLLLNGWRLIAGDAGCVMTALSLAAGTLEEADFARWLRENSVRS